MLKTGDRIPEATLRQMTADGPAEVNTTEYCAGRKVILFAVPGAFTPTCSESHLPGFVSHADELKDKGIDRIACVSTADFFVLDAWARSRNVGDSIDMLSDGNAEFTRAAGMTLDLSSLGLGERTNRYSMVLDDGVITHLHVEEDPTQADESGAAKLLSEL